MKNILFILTLTLCSLFSFAQLNQQEPKPYIEITGTAEMKINPNQIFINITLQENLDRSKKTVDDKEQELIKALQSKGISKEKLVVKDANAYYGKTGMIGKEVVRSKQLELEVKDATQARNAFEVLDKLNIKNAYISRVDHTEMEEYKKLAKIKAIKTAKTKANYLLEAVDEKLGKALIVRENSFYVNNPRFRQLANVSYDLEMADDKMEKVNLDFKQITINASIYTKWRIGVE